MIGQAQRDRTPGPKTASRKGQKITILELSPGFPFITMNQRVDGFTMVLSVTMILSVWNSFITFLSQWDGWVSTRLSYYFL